MARKQPLVAQYPTRKPGENDPARKQTETETERERERTTEIYPDPDPDKPEPPDERKDE